MLKKKRVSLAMLGLALLSILAFQNCSDFSLQDQVLYDQAVLESKAYLDNLHLSDLISLKNQSLVRWYKKSDPGFYQVSTIFGSQWTIVAAVDRDVTGRIISVNTNVGEDDGYLTVVGGKLRAVRQGSGYTQYKEVPLPTAGQQFVVAVSFGAAKGDINLMVNGILQQANVVNTGFAEDFLYIQKTIQTTGLAKVLEYMVYTGSPEYLTGKLNVAQLNVLSRYLGNSNMIPQVLFDPILFNEIDQGTGIEVNPKFTLAKQVLDAKCVSCHRGQEYPNLSGLKESNAIRNGLVVPGNLAKSLVYNRLQGAGYEGTMPKAPMTLSASERQVIADWILSIK